MRSITEIISPVKLLSGTHSDAAETGRGCFMNVIAYLNGESQITDRSECVCVTIRPIAIWLNDFLRDQDRYKLLPYLERAIGSATEDLDVIIARLGLIVEFARAFAKSAESAEYAKYAELTDLGLKLMDDICPNLETHKSEIYDRAEALASLQECAR